MGCFNQMLVILIKTLLCLVERNWKWVIWIIEFVSQSEFLWKNINKSHFGFLHFMGILSILMAFSFIFQQALAFSRLSIQSTRLLFKSTTIPFFRYNNRMQLCMSTDKPYVVRPKDIRIPMDKWDFLYWAPFLRWADFLFL